MCLVSGEDCALHMLVLVITMGSRLDFKVGRDYIWKRSTTCMAFNVYARTKEMMDAKAEECSSSWDSRVLHASSKPTKERSLSWW